VATKDLTDWFGTSGVVNEDAFNEWLDAWVKAAMALWNEKKAPRIPGWTERNRTSKLPHGVF
jgi:hypothetical protein